MRTDLLVGKVTVLVTALGNDSSPFHVAPQYYIHYRYYQQDQSKEALKIY